MATMFDETALVEQVDGDMEFLADTVGMLADDGPDLIEQLRVAIDTLDGPSVGRIAHTLKGMVSNFCAPETQSIAFEIEKAGKADDLSTAAGLIDRMAEQLNALITELTDFIRTRA